MLSEQGTVAIWRQNPTKHWTSEPPTMSFSDTLWSRSRSGRNDKPREAPAVLTSQPLRSRDTACRLWLLARLSSSALGRRRRSLRCPRMSPGNSACVLFHPPTAFLPPTADSRGRDPASFFCCTRGQTLIKRTRQDCYRQADTPTAPWGTRGSCVQHREGPTRVCWRTAHSPLRISTLAALLLSMQTARPAVTLGNL